MSPSELDATPSVFSVAASADGRWFAAGLGSGRALIFSVDDPAHPVVVSGVGSSEVRVAFGPPDRPAALVAWSATAGADRVCLQVEEDNAPARPLYASLGIGREIYRYHYRRQPDASGPTDG